MEAYTTQRAIFDVTLIGNTTSIGRCAMGIINLPSAMNLNAGDPSTDPMWDWQYWGEQAVNRDTEVTINIHRDIATVRKSPGRDRTLWFYIRNSGVTSIIVAINGRVLALE